MHNIREVDAIIQVVRCFDDPNTIHVAGKVNPLDDIEVINTELALADMASVENKLPKFQKPQNQVIKMQFYCFRFLKKCKNY